METHNTREWEREFYQRFEHREQLCCNGDYCAGDCARKKADDIKAFIAHQLQKARQDWLREEKERTISLLIKEGYLKGRKLIPHDESKKSHGTCCYCGTCGHDNDYCVCEHNSLLQTIIDRYQAELDQDKNTQV